MKLQVAFDHTDLETCLKIAKDLEDICDQFEIGSLLIQNYGVAALQSFKKEFPNTTLVADTKIIDRGKDIATVYFESGADWVTVMGGTHQQVIHAVGSVAHAKSKRVMLDLFDTNLLGQAAMDAKTLGVHALIFHQPINQRSGQNTWYDKWDIVRGNTTLPILIGSEVSKDTLEGLLEVEPDGLILQGSIINAKNPREELNFIKEAVENFKAQKKQELQDAADSSTT